MTDREKLIEILSVPIYPHECADPAEVVADYLLDNGVTFAKDTDIPSKWISVEDRLPEIGRSVFAYSAYWESPEIARWAGDRWVSRLDNRTFWYVTHWMPLPKPPKEVAQT